MKIFLNGELFDISINANVDDLLNKFDYKNKKIAVEINKSIIPKSDYLSCKLQEGDNIEIITAIGGG